MVITVIRYGNDSYFGFEGKEEYPMTPHSGYIDEKRELQKWQEDKVSTFEKKLEDAIHLNKVHVKKALSEDITNWVEIFQRQLRDINYKLQHIHGFSDFSQLWKKEYTIYHLENSSLEDLTMPTEVDSPNL